MLETLKNMPWELIFLVLFGISEALALIPQVKSNSVFQLIFNLLAKLAKKPVPPQQ